MSIHTRKSSSSSEMEERTRLRNASLASEGGQSVRSHRSHRSHRHESVSHNPELASIAEKSTGRNQSPVGSQSSATAAGIPYDALSVTSTKTGLTSVSQRQEEDGPLSAPRGSISNDRHSISGSKRPSVHHQEHSTHRQSVASNVGHAAKLSSDHSKPKSRFDVSKAIFAQVDTNHDGLISRDEFRVWAQPGIVTADGETPPPSQEHRQSFAQPQEHRQSIAKPQEDRQSFAQPQEHRQSFAQPQEHRQSIAQPQEHRQSVSQPQEHRQSFAQPQEHRQSFAQPQEHRQSFAKPQDHRLSFAQPLEQRQSFSQSQEHRQSFAQPQEHRQSIAQSQEHRQSFAQPQEHRQSFAQPQEHRQSFAQPQEHRQSFAQPQEHRQSFAQPQEHRQSFAQPQEHRQSIAQSQEHRQSFAQPQEHRQSFAQGQQHRPSLHPPYVTNPNPEQQRVNSLLGPDAFKDVALNIDYGAVEAYNVAMKSAEDPVSDQVRRSSVGSVGGSGQRFDVVKAIFNQADANHDGSIDREEFRQWATALGAPGTRPRGSQHKIHRSSTAGNFSLNNAQVYDDTTPEAANILEQSGMAPNYSGY